ncbi:MAG: dimethyl sulfoxide reductase anchor subunit [Acetobacteraceae bacterium]|nr:dimethyl sulfoxide reductase anchor subunit [Acetobacteraceae bacterium]
MFSADWPLVVFTLLVQMAVGLVIVSELASLAGGAGAKHLLVHRDIASLVLGALGLLVSFAHLGSPMHSPYAILNLAHSWLSREILCTGLFLGCVFALTVARRVPAFAALSGLLATLAGLMGVVTVFAMSKVYAIVTVPAWNSPATFLNFLGSALLLGTLASGLLASFRWAGAGNAATSASLARVTLVLLLFVALGLAAKFVEIPFSLIGGMAENARGVSAVSAVLADGIGLFVLRIVLLVAGSALFVYVAVLAMRSGMAMLPAIGACAFLLTLAGEVLGRAEFFRMHVLFGL